MSWLLRSKSTDKQNQDKKSITLIWITIVSAILLSVYVSSAFYFPISKNSVSQQIGIGLLLLGMGIRLAVVYSLGKFFTVDVTIRQNHKLKTDGFYKYLRHPSYTASLISFIGMALTFNNWLSVVILVGFVFLSFTYRIKIEEEALLAHFGKEYRDYQKLTYRMIPFLY